ncbi:MAG: CDC48 family AAA ATPase [Candidatus Hydrothermarchaeales archaeon]
MEIELKVAEALKNDVGRGVVRLDTKSRDALKVTAGDFVEIDGKNSTGAVVWRAHDVDEGLGIVRMDGLLRQNALVSLGDKVRIKNVEVKEAKSLTIAPARAIRFSPGFEDFVNRRLLGRAISKGDKIVIVVLGTALPFTIVQTNPSGILQVSSSTQVKVREQPMEFERAGLPTVTYEDIGGLGDEVQKVREMIELPMKHPELFDKLGINPPKGVLLHGPPGTGKTLIAKAVANETNAYFSSLNGPEIMSKFYGESEENLRKMFQDAEENAPSIVFIDEIDAIAPKREEVTGEVERRVVAQLLALMDGLKGRGELVVIGATNRPDALDPAIRRPGRFDREIVIGVPDRNGRKEILQIHTRGMPLGDDVDLDKLADVTHGFVGADLESLCKEAAMNALRKVLPEIDLEEESIPPEILENLKVDKEDFLEALKLAEPSALREVFVELPDVTWNDVGGLGEIKRELVEGVEWPIKHPEAFNQMGIKPPKGILLFGPPGSGKTLLAKAVAHESESNFISIKGPEVLSKWVGESEKAIREIFKKAKQSAPTVVFFDEIDAIAARRGVEVGSRVGERIVNQLLTEMDGLEEVYGIIIIAATNRPDILDPGILRPGRFDKLLLVQAPDEEARLQIFKVHTKGMPLGEDVDLEKLAKQTKDYVGADIEALCRESAMLAIRETLDEGSEIKNKKVELSHFNKALKKIKPSVNESIKKFYEDILKRYEARETEDLRYMT